ncbi:hypothetical protein [Portibacter marinus]|uniref:hypothetical protein n=1 Tax=Portibacter marinus TaxID=2898660 RepID=UPI001F172F5E|nr:hypothetical protein [Portibacter marinus]
MKYFITLLLTISYLSINAQRNHAVYGELLGNGFFYSLNYEFAIAKTDKNWRAKVGVSTLAYPFAITQISYLFGKKKYFMEVGAGANFLPFSNDNEKLSLLLTPNAALQFRYESSGGLLFRIGLAPSFIPLFDDEPAFADPNNWIWPGVSLGYTFGK